ncbi:MAG: hypothetical protein Q4F83_06875 [Eubacteriales bacterium]|nr:hypothetical protein [Eubacteriales bacterium]
MKSFKEGVMKFSKVVLATFAMIMMVGALPLSAKAVSAPSLYVSDNNSYNNKSTFATTDTIYLNTKFMSSIKCYQVKITGPGWNYSTTINNSTNATRFRLSDYFSGSYRGAGAYKWQVRAIDKKGRYSKWATRTFNVIPGKVSLGSKYRSGNFVYIHFSTQSKISGYQILYWNGSNWRHYSMIRPSNSYLKMGYSNYLRYPFKIRAYRDYNGKRYFGLASDRF